MKELIINFEQTGICEVATEKVIKKWTDKFSISQYHEEYTLVKQGRGTNYAKIRISQTQAEEIIVGLNLLPIKSGLLRNAKTFKTRDIIISEINRISKIQQEKQEELYSIISIINEYKQALTTSCKQPTTTQPQ
jgi:hypothetical protein